MSNGEQAASLVRPEVSVITASYNYDRYIGEAVESVLAQSMPHWELIVVDDGSSDSSLTLLDAYRRQDERIRLFRHPDGKNHGLAETLQMGLGKAQGRYIAFLEADDAWTPDSLEKRLRILRESKADAVFGHIRVMDERGAVAGWHMAVLSAERRFQGQKFPQRFLGKLLTRNCIPTFSCVMLKAKLLHGLNFNAPVPRWLDWWLWLQAAAKGTFVYAPEVCALWRKHEASYNVKRSFFAYLRDAARMWRGIRGLAPRKRLTAFERLFIMLPVVFPLALRLAGMIRTAGPVNAARCVYAKFSARKKARHGIRKKGLAGERAAEVISESVKSL